MNNESQPLFKKCVSASLRFKFVKSNILVNSYQSFPATIVSVSLARVIEIGFGVPVVSTKVGGVPEIVADGETGILVEQSSSVILGKAIIEILGDKDFSEVRKITEKRTRERFSVKEMASRTVEMYSRVMSLDNSND